MRSGQVDGVLLFSSRLSNEGSTEIDGKVPVLLVCNAMPELAGLPVVEVANRDAAFEMTSYLIGLGHRRLGHVTGPRRNVEAEERLTGFRNAAAAARIAEKDLHVWDGTFSFEAGAAAARRFLALSRRPTVVFCASDQIAIGFIKTVRDAGLAVPEDVSVAGFDDIEFANLFSPALTTMRQPRAALGRAAAEYLVGRMNGTGDAAPQRIRLPCVLIVRDSVRPVQPARRSRAVIGTSAIGV